MRGGLGGVWRALRRDRGACLGLGLVVLTLLMALLADIGPYQPTQRFTPTDGGAGLARAPTSEHLLGTDNAGYDVATRLLHGARLTLLTGVLAVVLSLLVGVPGGLLSGWVGGRVDGWLMRLTDVLLAFPSVVLAIAIAALFDHEAARTTLHRLLPVIVAVSVVSVPVIARQVRASVLQVRTLDYVTAAVGMGLSPGRILWKHVLPNCLAPILVTIS